MHKIYLAAVVLFIMIASAPLSSAATIQGTAYEWWSFKRLENVIVELYYAEQFPENRLQRLVAENGTYSFTVGQGSYTIVGKYYKYNLLTYYAEENITVQQDDDITLDLIMFPAPEDETLYGENFEVPSEQPSGERGPSFIYLAVSVVIVAALGSAFLLYGRRWAKIPVKAQRVSEGPEVGLPADLKEVMGAIVGAGGRITQTELRKKLPYSEAKVSLMIADLEDRGLVRKIKKGRGNIVVLKE